MFRQAAVFAVMLLTAGTPGLAAAGQVATTDVPTPMIASSAAIALIESGPEPTAILAPLPPVARRPSLLPALYAGFAVLQVMDVTSTKSALAAGGRETNPLMRNRNMSTTIAVKAASATATVYLTERLWKQNRVAAIVVMTAINGVGLAIVAHNGRVARRQGIR